MVPKRRPTPKVIVAAATPKRTWRRPDRSALRPVITVIAASNDEQPDHAQHDADDERCCPCDEEIGQDGDDRAHRKEEERRYRRHPGGSAQLLRIDAQFLPRQGIQGRLLVLHEPLPELAPAAVEPLGLVDQRQLLRLLRGASNSSRSIPI